MLIKNENPNIYAPAIPGLKHYVQILIVSLTSDRSGNYVVIFKNKNLERKWVNPYPAELIYLNFYPLEVAYRYRDPQLQMDEKLLIFVQFKRKYLKIFMFRHTFYSQ